jgi:Prealbumin-like fold domain
MSKVTRRAGLVGALAIATSLLMILPASATVISLTGSSFEIDDDANLVVDVVGNDDWVTVTESRAQDTPSGQNDNAFGNGSKEDTEPPSVVAGGIPNNKSDLLNFGVYLETTAAGDKFLNVFWRRVQDPTGTTNMDFEFNHNDLSTLSANNTTPIRTEGDILIQYDLTSGGTHPELFLSRWVTTGPKSLCEAANSTPCWGDRENLTTAGDATGSINTTPIVDDPATTTLDETDGLGSMSARTFGEAQIDFSRFTGGTGCAGFGSAYLKSRSSDSFTAALKDFIAPIDLNFNDCGALKITKTVKVPGNGTQGQEGVNFTITDEDATVVFSGATDPNGEICVDGLNAGDYTAQEEVPDGYQAAGDNPQTTAVAADGSTCSDEPYTGASLSFVNTPLTDLTVTATAQVAGATKSTISCVDASNNSVIAVSTPVDPASGTATGLEPGTYTCTVVIDP